MRSAGAGVRKSQRISRMRECPDGTGTSRAVHHQKSLASWRSEVTEGRSMANLPLSDWRDFYVTIGTASGAIVGASFIVATLASELKERTLGLRGFITPTAVYPGSVPVASVFRTAAP